MMQELHNLNIEGRPDICVFAKEIYSEEQFLKMLSSGEKFAIGAGENGAKRTDLLVWGSTRTQLNFIMPWEWIFKALFLKKRYEMF